MPRIALPLALLVSSATLFCQTNSTGNNNQTVGTNKGVVIQNNISVTQTTRTELKVRAKEDTGSEQGWLRILTPANDPTPTTTTFCHHSNAALKVFLGTVEGSCDGANCSILQDGDTTANTRELLSVQRAGSSLLINGVVFGDDGKIIVALDQNRPHINKNNAFSWKRPDSHTIDVIDQKNQKVLHVRFMNKTAIYVEGLFYTESHRRLKIDPNVVHAPGISISGGCSENSGTVLAF